MLKAKVSVSSRLIVSFINKVIAGLTETVRVTGSRETNKEAAIKGRDKTKAMTRIFASEENGV